MDSNQTSGSYPRQGEIYLSRALRQLGDTKKRPVVVVSMNTRDELSDSVIVVPFTSEIAGGENPTRILIAAGEGGWETDSLAVCENVSAISPVFDIFCVPSPEGLGTQKISRVPWDKSTAGDIELAQNLSGTRSIR
ncbi:MAG: type II toxin-antitoxin system PemK/MazF family toxin [Hormoscilla sp. GUM202]|nr:type II toxin-antitoxin system PemK/MazF family toxin [Hormoscilla sp. GUM202]